MKSFQPKAPPPEADGSAEGPDDEDPGAPPVPSPAPETPATEAKTDPMPRSPRQNRNAEVDFRGEKRSNATHASITDPEARLYKKSPGTGAMLCFIGGGGSEKGPGDLFSRRRP